MRQFGRLIRRIPSSVWAGIVLIIFFAIFANGYLSGRNILNILRSSTALMVVSAGMTLCILMAQIDMSVGGVITAAATSAGLYLQAVAPVTVFNVLVAIIICLAVGFAFGLLNGFLIGTLNFNFWLVTFGTMSIGFGLSKVLTGGGVLSGFDKKFQWISNGKPFGVSMCIIWAAIFCVIMLFIQLRSRFGLHIYAIGDSEQCAENSGINVRRTRFWAYALSGLFAGIAAMLLLSRTNSGSATLGDGYEFNAIAAVIIGGTAMEGGKGGFGGTIFGAIFISAMKNGLQLIGLSTYWQQVLLGIVILAIILYDVILTRATSRRKLRRVYSNG